MRIGIGIHGVSTVPTAIYFNHLARMGSWMKWAVAEGHSLAMVAVDRTIVSRAREKIVKDLLELECDYWLSLDTDHVVPVELLPELFKLFPGPAMASGLINKRVYPFEPVVYGLVDAGNGEKMFMGLQIDHHTGVHEVDGCAFGCTLIDLKKTEALPTPRFRDTSKGRSDLNLCKAFREKGERVLVNSDIMVGHLAQPYPVTPDTVEERRARVIERMT